MVTESTGMGNLLMTTMMVKMMATGMQARIKNQPSTGPKERWTETSPAGEEAMVSLVESWKRLPISDLAVVVVVVEGSGDSEESQEGDDQRDEDQSGNGEESNAENVHSEHEEELTLSPSERPCKESFANKQT